MSLHVEVVGEGRDLVLVHGWAMHGGIFAPLTHLLASRFRLHLVDLPGHGFSVADVGSLDPAECARRIAVAVPRAIWVGWSLGGLTVLQAALNHNDQIDGIVEMAASPCFVARPDWPCAMAPETLAQFTAGLGAGYRQTVERFIALETLGSPNAQVELRDLRARVFERGEPSPPALHEGLRVLETADLRANLDQLRVPSLWLAGRRDRLIPSAAMQRAAAQCPQGSFVEINSGHAPFISHATEVANAIARFANGLAAS